MDLGTVNRTKDSGILGLVTLIMNGSQFLGFRPCDLWTRKSVFFRLVTTIRIGS